MSKVDEFNNYREKMNERILSSDNKLVKRIFNLDTNAFSEGAIDVKNKEMLGLACSMVLRCDDCVRYHLGKCYELGCSDKEMDITKCLKKTWTSRGSGRRYLAN